MLVCGLGHWIKKFGDIGAAKKKEKMFYPTKALGLRFFKIYF